jgi:hypothetical protein
MERGGRHPPRRTAARAVPPSAGRPRRPSFLGVVKTSIGIKDGRVVGIGRAGSPDITEGDEPTIGPNTWPVGRSPRRDRGDRVSSTRSTKSAASRPRRRPVRRHGRRPPWKLPGPPTSRPRRLSAGSQIRRPLRAHSPGSSLHVTRKRRDPSAIGNHDRRAPRVVVRTRRRAVGGRRRDPAVATLLIQPVAIEIVIMAIQRIVSHPFTRCMNTGSLGWTPQGLHVPGHDYERFLALGFLEPVLAFVFLAPVFRAVVLRAPVLRAVDLRAPAFLAPAWLRSSEWRSCEHRPSWLLSSWLLSSWLRSSEWSLTSSSWACGRAQAGGRRCRCIPCAPVRSRPGATAVPLPSCMDSPGKEPCQRHEGLDRSI